MKEIWTGIQVAFSAIGGMLGWFPVQISFIFIYLLVLLCIKKSGRPCMDDRSKEIKRLKKP